MRRRIVLLSMLLLSVAVLSACNWRSQKEPARPVDTPVAAGDQDKTDEPKKEPVTAPAKKEEPASTGPAVAEKTILQKLEPFKAKHELNDKGEVVRVVLEGSHVTDAALDEVVKLPHLKRLSLARSSVTDAGLAKLQGVVWLEGLGITDTPVTDKGLKHLEKIPSLHHLWVCENDKLTKEGIAALKQSLVGLNVYVMNKSAKKKQDDKK
jgi:hypothetical protein